MSTWWQVYLNMEVRPFKKWSCLLKMYNKIGITKMKNHRQFKCFFLLFRLKSFFKLRQKALTGKSKLSINQSRLLIQDFKSTLDFLSSRQTQSQLPAEIIFRCVCVCSCVCACTCTVYGLWNLIPGVFTQLPAEPVITWANWMLGAQVRDLPSSRMLTPV